MSGSNRKEHKLFCVYNSIKESVVPSPEATEESPVRMSSTGTGLSSKLLEARMKRQYQRSGSLQSNPAEDRRATHKYEFEDGQDEMPRQSLLRESMHPNNQINNTSIDAAVKKLETKSTTKVSSAAKKKSLIGAVRKPISEKSLSGAIAKKKGPSMTLADQKPAAKPQTKLKEESKLLYLAYSKTNVQKETRRSFFEQSSSISELDTDLPLNKRVQLTVPKILANLSQVDETLSSLLSDSPFKTRQLRSELALAKTKSEVTQARPEQDEATSGPSANIYSDRFIKGLDSHARSRRDTRQDSVVKRVLTLSKNKQPTNYTLLF